MHLTYVTIWCKNLHMDSESTLIGRITAIIEAADPNTWVVLEDHIMRDKHRLQIAANQAARRLSVNIVTRTFNGIPHFCVVERT